MTVLVLGGTGFVGQPLVRALAGLDVEVIAASRAGNGPKGVPLDRRDVDGVRALVRERRIETVVDLLAYTEADTLPLLTALDGEVGRWVMASSCDVYRNYEGLHRKAQPEPILEPMAEDSPMRELRHPYRAAPRRDPIAPDAWMDDYDKIPLEAALRARPGLSGVILRLPMIYGPADRQRRFRWLIGPMLAGRERITVDPTWLAWRTTYGYVDDVAHALATAAVHPGVTGRTFNVGETNAPDHRVWAGRFGQALGWRGEVELASAPASSPLAALDLRYPLVSDSNAFRSVCNWQEPTSLEDALAATIADDRSRG